MDSKKYIPKLIILLISSISLSGRLLVSKAGYAQDVQGSAQIDQATLEEKLNRLRDIDSQLLKLEQEEKRLHQLEQKAKKLKDQEQIEALIQQEKYFETLERQEKERIKQLKQDELKAIKLQKQKEQADKKAEKLAARQKEKAAKKEEKLAAKQQSQPPDEGKTNSAPIKLVDAQTNFNRETDGEGQVNQKIEGTAQFELFNGDNLSLTSGYNRYEQADVDSITNIPVKIAWEREIGDFTLSAKAGVDLYNRIAGVPSGSIGVKHAASPKWLKSLTTSAEVEYAPYKFNAQTIENDIRYLRLKGSIFADINKNTSFFTAAHAGVLNDGNQEYQVFSRLERKLNKNFYLAGNLFAWGFAKDVSSTSGYFSPSSFLVYNAELGWQEDITDFLDCKLSASLGQQHVEGDTSQTNSLKGGCKISIGDDIEFDVDYTYSNVNSGFNISEGSSFSNSINSKLKFKY